MNKVIVASTLLLIVWASSIHAQAFGPTTKINQGTLTGLLLPQYALRFFFFHIYFYSFPPVKLIF